MKTNGPPICLHCIKKIKCLIPYIVYEAIFSKFQNMQIVAIYMY